MQTRKGLTRPKVLVLDALYYPIGGTLVIPSWTMEAIKHVYDVSLLSWNPPDFAAMNRTCGTSLSTADVTLLRPPRWVHTLGEGLRAVDPDPWSILRWALLMRYGSWIAHRFDLVISTLNEADLNGQGIQYVHYPNQGPPYADQRRRGRRRPWQVLAGFSYDRMLKNRTIANSDWTSGEVRKFYGIDCRTIYPPGAGDFPSVPWEDREDGFVCVGRLERDKRILEMIRIVAEIRTHRPSAHLHVIGTRGLGKTSDQYLVDLHAAAAAHPGCVFFEEHLSRSDLSHLLAHHRYGLHAKVDEHFGCALAEMTSAGCIVFSHRSGGPMEILGHDDALLFRDEREAVTTITGVMTDAAEQTRLRQLLAARAAHWKPERFMREMREAIAEFLAARAAAHTATTCSSAS